MKILSYDVYSTSDGLEIWLVELNEDDLVSMRAKAMYNLVSVSSLVFVEGVLG